MRAKWKVMVGFVAIGVLSALLLLLPGAGARRMVENTRLSLRQQGFKVDLAEFDLSASEELRSRSAALTNAARLGGRRGGGGNARRFGLLQGAPDLTVMTGIGSNSAVVMSREDKLLSIDAGSDYWPALRETIDENRAELEAAGEAALAGPIRFDLRAAAGNGMLLPHLAALKGLVQILGTCTLLDLHDGGTDGAWTNVLATTRLVTAWEPEPAEVSHLVRFACATIAFNATWQALQVQSWTDDRLARLQREWESVDFFKSLPETVAFARASMVATCQLERQQPLSLPVASLSDLVRSPQSVWYGLTGYWSQLRYRRHGTYEDERDLLLYYLDRELEIRQAIQRPTWSEMRRLPGVATVIPFQSRHPSAMQSLLNLKQLRLAWQMYAGDPNGFGQRGQGFLGRAAEAEARRRIIITAIALERHRLRQGSYPGGLQELVPELLKESPIDFMDGRPLRYAPTGDGQFVLYSVGLDCVDHGGVMGRAGQHVLFLQKSRGRGIAEDADLVWPRPASAAEAENARREQLKARAEIVDHNDELQSVQEWRRAAERQAKVGGILAAKPKAQSAEPTYRGRLLCDVLGNENASGTNKFTLDELLTLRMVTTGEEPETVTFEVPIKYDALSNLGAPQLYVDPAPDEDSDEGWAVGQLECRRATNGNCLLLWRTIYESPGKHALRLGLELNEPEEASEALLGPVAPFVVSNLCQFSVSSATFNPAFGATLRAKLPESNGTYAVTITSPAGDRLTTVSGRTTNGVITVRWDLMDDQGRKCTNEFFDTFFHIALPDSGQSQTLKGP